MFCSEMPGEGRPGWDLSEGDTRSDINYWLLSSARSPSRHQQMVDSMGEGGQSRYKAWAYLELEDTLSFEGSKLKA